MSDFLLVCLPAVHIISVSSVVSHLLDTVCMGKLRLNGWTAELLER